MANKQPPFDYIKQFSDWANSTAHDEFMASLRRSLNATHWLFAPGGPCAKPKQPPRPPKKPRPTKGY